MAETVRQVMATFPVDAGRERKTPQQGDAFLEALEANPALPRGEEKELDMPLQPRPRQGWALFDQAALTISSHLSRHIASQDKGEGEEITDIDRLAAAVEMPAADADLEEEAVVPLPVAMEEDDAATLAAGEVTEVPSYPLTGPERPKPQTTSESAPPRVMPNQARRQSDQPAVEVTESRTEPEISAPDRENAARPKDGLSSPLERMARPGANSDDDGRRQQPFSKDATSSSPAAVRVVSAQSIPAPASPLMTGDAPMASVLAGMKADPAMRAAAAEAANAIAQGTARADQPLHMLKIQLQPAELGMVTARLTISGERLVVELRVENAEARHRLQADHDGMVQALRSLGYEVDRITVQQAPNSASAHNGGGGTGRDSAFQAGFGQGQEKSPGQHHGGTGGSPFDRGSEAGERRSDDKAGGGLYI